MKDWRSLHLAIVGQSDPRDLRPAELAAWAGSAFTAAASMPTRRRGLVALWLSMYARRIEDDRASGQWRRRADALLGDGPVSEDEAAWVDGVMAPRAKYEAGMAAWKERFAAVMGRPPSMEDDE